MTQQEIIENNIQIAMFMGWKKKGYYRPGLLFGKKILAMTDGKRFSPCPWITTFKYHDDWNFLMPVVEEIKKMGYIVEIWMSLGCGCKIFNHKSQIANTESMTCIEATYLAVLDFIKFYNSNPRISE